jgi:hypothetical protein
MSEVIKFNPDYDPRTNTMMLIEQLRVERERLQAEIDRIVRDLQIQIDKSYESKESGSPDS